MPRVSKAESSRPQLLGGGCCQEWGHLSPLATLLGSSDDRARVSDEERKERVVTAN